MAVKLTGSGVLYLPFTQVAGSVELPLTDNVALFWNNGLKGKLSDGSLINAGDGSVSLDFRVREEDGSIDITGINDLIFPADSLTRISDSIVQVSFPEPAIIDSLTVKDTAGSITVTDVNVIEFENATLSNPTLNTARVLISPTSSGESSEPYVPRNRAFSEDITFSANQWSIYMGPAPTNAGGFSVNTTAGTVYVLDERLEKYPNFSYVAPDRIHVHGGGVIDNGSFGSSSGIRVVGSSFNELTQSDIWDWSYSVGLYDTSESVFSYVDNNTDQNAIPLFGLGQNRVITYATNVFFNDAGVSDWRAIEVEDGYVSWYASNDSRYWFMGPDVNLVNERNFVFDNDLTLAQTRPLIAWDFNGDAQNTITRMSFRDIEWSNRNSLENVNWYWSGDSGRKVEVSVPFDFSNITFFNGTMRSTQFSGFRPSSSTVPATFDSDARNILQYVLDLVLYYNLGP